MEIYRNRIFEWLSDSEEHEIYRIIWIDVPPTKVVVIRLHIESLETSMLEYERLQSAIAAREIRFLERDPYSCYVLPDHILSKKSCARRYKIWTLIESLVVSGIPDIFDPRKRGEMIRDVIKTTKVSKQSLYTYVRIYFQRGQSINALTFDSHKQGGKGKERIAEPEDKKRGRPSRDGERTGINKTQEVVEAFEYARELLESGEEKTKKKALREANKEFFNVGYEEKDGELVAILPPKEELPSPRQFQYYCSNHVDIVKLKRAAVGENRFNANCRPLSENATARAYGPGAIYGFDFTVINTYLTSLLNPADIVRRAHLCIGVDWFSHMIVGAVCNFEEESWIGYQLTIENAALDKVEYCDEYGIDIDRDQWPCVGTPAAGYIDRGGAFSRNLAHVTRSTGINFSIAPPYRPDFKGIVEILIHIANCLACGDTPGSVPKVCGRGDKDYRLDACLNIYEFRRLLLRAILFYNQYQYIIDYPNDLFMIADGVKKIPLELWNWGIENRGNYLTYHDQSYLHSNLLPRAEASITTYGLTFEGNYYECDLPEVQQEIEIARQRVSVKKRREKVWISYNPHEKSTVIYLDLGRGNLAPCHQVAKNKTEKFVGLSFHEIKVYRANDAQEARDQEARQQQPLVEKETHHNATVKAAVERTEQAVEESGLSRNARKKGIRENTKLDREYEREQRNQNTQSKTAQEVDTSQSILPPKQSQQPTIEQKKYVAPPSHLSLLHQLANEDKEKT